MNSKQIFRNRAILAYWLLSDAKANVTDIAKILRCTGREDVMELLAQGSTLNQAMMGNGNSERPLACIGLHPHWAEYITTKK